MMKELLSKLTAITETVYVADSCSISRLQNDIDKRRALRAALKGCEDVKTLLVLATNNDKNIVWVAEEQLASVFLEWLNDRIEINHISIDYDGDEDGSIHPYLSGETEGDARWQVEQAAETFCAYHRLPGAIEKMLYKEGLESTVRELVSLGLEQEREERDEEDYKRAHAAGRV